MSEMVEYFELETPIPVEWREDKKKFVYEYLMRWYWKDDDCDEPIGPFDTQEEAELDYNDMVYLRSGGKI